MKNPVPWWNPDYHSARRPFLLARTRILQGLRNWFENKGFLEIEASSLQVSPGNETHLHAFSTLLTTTDGQSSRLYLQTSPEFACKKLLAAGETKICTFARVYRNRERTALHHPEFLMLEWYRAGAPYEQLIEDCGELLKLAAKAAGNDLFSYKGKIADPFAAIEILTIAEAFQRHAGIDLMATLDADGTPILASLATAAQNQGIRIAGDDSWSDVFSRIMAEKIEPFLGVGVPTALIEYPISEAALARPSPHDPRVAERFELYVCGVELANAFGELTEPAEQKRRFSADMDEKQRIYGERYPIDAELLAALALMPETSGIALGFDRLVMLATHAARIEDVIWTPVAGMGEEVT
jgi:elongation factor P--(R)-beta-lysine ligase